MALKPSTQKKNGNIAKGIGIGLVVSLLGTVLGSAIAAWVLATEKIGEGSVGYIAVIMLLLSSMFGALASSTCIQQKRLPVCLLSGGVYLISLLPFIIFLLLDNNLSLVYLLLMIYGSTLGFLVLNLHPAKIFMGDTGSLA